MANPAALAVEYQEQKIAQWLIERGADVMPEPR